MDMIRRRGFCCIGMVNPKTPENVGSVMRASGCYGVSSVFYTGKRYAKAKQFVTDPQKFHRHIPLIHTDDLHSIIPFNCMPIAVDLIDDAESIVDYRHPQRALYIFGPEDGTLGKQIIEWCKDKIYVPTNLCMNLAATVNVVLYDRLSKYMRGLCGER